MRELTLRERVGVLLMDAAVSIIGLDLEAKMKIYIAVQAWLKRDE